jgi:DNA replication and repair protein RecF
VSVRKLSIRNFRCLTSVEFEPDPGINVIFGPNGAGKTSILEALFFIGRGRSFRSGTRSTFVQSGTEEFTIFAEVSERDSTRRLGLSSGRDGLQVQIDGDRGGRTAELVRALPVQVIDPSVHELVQGGPKGRRRFLDWGVFHVKHNFFPDWRRYKKALQQRNEALRQGLSRDAVAAWESELIEMGMEIDALRRSYLDSFRPAFEDMALALLGLPAKIEYRSGWQHDRTLFDAIHASWDRDAALGRTHVGPHRAELALVVDNAAARHRLSRGQQKLLGISMVLAQSQFVARQLDRTVALLVDEPAAELDSERLAKLLDVLQETRTQLFVTALDREALPIDSASRSFHVERGEVATLV